MKRNWIVTAAVCLAVLLIASLATGYWENPQREEKLKVGFIYSEDESTPYTANFVRAQRALEEKYGDEIEVISRSNVVGRECERPMIEMVQDGCQILFINLDSEIPVTLAWQYPEVQFCQVSLPTVSMEGTPENYHTFNGEIYQARYASGVAAGMKLRQLIDGGELQPEEAIVGYVGANSSTEVISGYTAFLLGVRSVAPEATMRVRYTGSWGNFPAEKETTGKLIEEGCVLIAQHVNTAAPAIACEEAAAEGKTVYHIGYHQSMMDVAPSCALLSLRTNWAPYILEATEAVLKEKKIEETVQANRHGRDMSAGFESGWVELLDLNKLLAAPGTEERLAQTTESLKKGRIQVFSGNYTGVNPRNAGDTVDLTEPYEEHRNSSCPSFGYVLRDVITVEE